jgi:hypothetical protein
MADKIRLLLRKNRANGQTNVSIPIKKIPSSLRKKIKYLDINLRNFKW